MIFRGAAGSIRALRPSALSSTYHLCQRSKAIRFESTAVADNKIDGIVNQISQLTLLETADLVTVLKVFVTQKRSSKSYDYYSRRR